MRFAHADEQWRPVPGFEGKYEVSDLGRVKSLRWTPPRILRPGPSNYGHLSVALGQRNTRMIHQLVLLAFVGPRPPGQEARHLDGDPANNRLDNLCWGTRGDNIRDAVRHGTWESDKRAAGRRSTANLAGLVRARAAQTREGILAALAKGRQTRWGSR
jgi:hypothetical protein